MPATQHEEVYAGYFNFRPYFNFWPAWKTSFGMRYNRLKENSSVNWNASSRMPFFNDALYLAISAGTAFKLPSSTSLFAQLIGNRTSEGNPDLKPQESLFYNVAVGGNWAYGGLELYFFWESISDRIATVQGSGAWIPHLNQYANKYQNIPGKTKIRGYTFTGRLGPFAGFSSTASITRQEEIRNGEKQEYLPLFPEMFGNVVVRWDGSLGDWKAGIGVINSYTGRMKSQLTNFNTITVKEYGKYWTTDIDLHVKPMENLTIALQLSNIFEKGDVYSGWYRLRPQANGPLAGKESSDGFYYYGNKVAPFTATLSVTYDF
jgi:outer membrane cobalamin receptor